MLCFFHADGYKDITLASLFLSVIQSFLEDISLYKCVNIQKYRIYIIRAALWCSLWKVRTSGIWIFLVANVDCQAMIGPSNEGIYLCHYFSTVWLLENERGLFGYFACLNKPNQTVSLIRKDQKQQKKFSFSTPNLAQEIKCQRIEGTQISHHFLSDGRLVETPSVPSMSGPSTSHVYSLGYFSALSWQKKSATLP